VGKDREKSMRNGLVVAALVSLLAASCIALAAWKAGAKADDVREERITYNLGRLADKMIQVLPPDVVNRVYDCRATRNLVPCPDYTATVAFADEGASKPPRVTPAFTADGELAIGLELENMADTCVQCSDHWSVKISAGEGVAIFAGNHTFNRNWMGPEFKPATPDDLKYDKLTMYVSDPGYTVEIYAVSTDPSVVGEPLADGRLGL